MPDRERKRWGEREMGPPLFPYKGLSFEGGQ